MAATTPAFPFWVNEIPAITELQRLRRPSSDDNVSDHATTGATSLLSIRDLFRCNTRDPKECWHYVLLSSYMTDLEWVLTVVPELSAVTEKVVLLSGDKGTATLRKAEDGRYLPTAAAMNRVNPLLKALRIVAQRRRQEKGGCCPLLTLERFAALEPPLPIAFGTHHTKMAVCVNARGVRVCVFTANLLEQDWCWKTQGIYVQDFPWAESTEVPPAPTSFLPQHPSQQQNVKGHDFKQQLQHYWTHCGLDMSAAFSWDAAKALPLGIFNTDFLAHVDFAAVRVWLVSSVPGSHPSGEASPGYRVGLCRLAEVLQRSAFSTPPHTELPVTLTWQYSSQGSLTPAFLSALEAAMCGAPELTASAGDAAPDAKRSSSSPLRPPARVWEVQIIYPTEAEVRSSLEGWRGGGSLPVRLQCCDEYVNERLHRWACPRSRLMRQEQSQSHEERSSTSAESSAPSLAAAPHDRRESALNVDELVEGEDATLPCAAVYRQYAMPHIKSYAAMDVARTHLYWYLLTSANLSQAAWGSLTAKNARKAPQRLLVRSYELGVLYDGTSVVDTSWFSVVSSPRIHLPTAANSKHTLFATPMYSERSSNDRDTCGAGDVTRPTMLLPCDMLRPQPYASTAALRAQRLQDGASSASPRSTVWSRQDVPWVVDVLHSGRDAYGCDVEEAFAAETLPPLSRWRPLAESAGRGEWREVAANVVTALKRPRDG
jgi:tyrosyl-DNA phosphodiesterase 1